MKVVITDLTRMNDDHICVAGIDLDTGHRVRPVLTENTRLNLGERLRTLANT